MEKSQLLSSKLLQSLIVIHWERGTRIFKMPLKQDKETTNTRSVVYTPKKAYSLFKHFRKERDVTLVQLNASTSITQKKLKQAVRSLF